MFWDRVSRATSNLNRIDSNYSRTYLSCFRENTGLSINGLKSYYHMPSSAKFCVASIVPVERPLVVRMSGDGFNLQYFRNQNRSTTTFILVLEEFFAWHFFKPIYIYINDSHLILLRRDDRKTDTQTGRQTHRQEDRHTDRKTDIQTGGQTHRLETNRLQNDIKKLNVSCNDTWQTCKQSFY